MFKRVLTILLVLGSLFLTVNAAYAVTTTYMVNYEKDSKYKPLPLKNATLRIQIYANGNSQGILTKRTDDNQKFTLLHKYGDRLVVEVISIKGEPKNVSCHGTAQKGKSELLINCHHRYQKDHFY